MPHDPARLNRPLTRQSIADGVAIEAAVLIGAPVYTTDGRSLGRVKKVGAECFLVDVRFAFDYWLSSRAIAGLDEGRVQLGIDKRQVADYLVDRDCLQDFDGLPPVSASPVVLLGA